MTGVQVGLVISCTDIHWEPLNLAHCYPTSHPNDLQLDLAPSNLCVISPFPFAKAAVDVHMASSFISQSSGDSCFLYGSPH